MSHIQDFGDATTSPKRDAAPRKRDESVNMGDVNCYGRCYISCGK